MRQMLGLFSEIGIYFFLNHILLIFVELSFVKWIVLPSVFSLAVKLIVDKLSLVQRAWRVGELAPPIHLVPFPLPLIHGPVRRGVDTVTVPLQWTVTTMLVFSICNRQNRNTNESFWKTENCLFLIKAKVSRVIVNYSQHGSYIS